MKKKLLRLFKMVSKFTLYGAFLQFLFLNLVLAHSSDAQKFSSVKDVEIEVEFHHSDLVDVIHKIESETDYQFVYYTPDFKNIRNFSLNRQRITVGGLLMKLAESYHVAFRQVNNSITIKKLPKKRINEISPLEIILEGITVTGKVTSAEDNEGLPGVNVIVKGTAQGTVTDVEGSYKLDVPDESTVLVFSSVGYTSQEIEVGGRSIIDLMLVPDVTALEEIVVIGYGTQKKSDLTGAVSSVKGKDIEDIAVQSIDQTLRGRVAGAKVTQSSGQPGSGTLIQIRGINSIQGGNDPLIIVDGFPLTGGLDFIDPKDIASVEVLKDASSTAIYGARASNGVIIITTKKGEAGRMKIDFDSYYGMQNVVRRMEFANAQDFIKIANARSLNDGESEPYFPDPSAITVDTDWQDEVLRSAPIQRYNLTLSGGTEKLRFSFSGNYFDQVGVIKGTDFSRFTLRSNLDAELNEWVSITNSLILARQVQNRGSQDILSMAFRSAPTLPVFDENGDFQDMSVYPFSDGDTDNPAAVIAGNTIKDTETRIFNNFSATFKLIEGLTFRPSIGVDYNGLLGDRYVARYLLDGAPGSRAEKLHRESYSILNENILNYTKEFNQIRLDAIAGYTWQYFESRNFFAGSANFVSDDLLNNALSSGSDILIPNSGGYEWGIVSWLGRVNLNYNERYLLTLSARADGSSRFSEDNRWAFFPSLAVAWRLSEEDWLRNSETLSDLKLRVSAGQTGNQAVSPYQTLVRMSDVQTSLGNRLNIGFAPANIANKELQWETTTQYDVGLDAGFFEGRLRFSADYYHKLTEDLLAQVDLPLSAGFTSSTQNIGSIKNYGFEFQIGATPMSGEFMWDINANLYTNTNEIVELSKGADVFAPDLDLLSSMHILREGQPISMFYGYLWDRIGENGQNVYKDLNDDGTINDLDRTIIGSPHPDFNFGFDNTFTYKNFELNFLLEGSIGHEILNIAIYEHADSFYKGRNQIEAVAQDFWTPENQDAKYPVPSASVTQLPSDIYVEDASYMKIRHISLAYSIPVESIDWLRHINVYISSENLLTVTNYSWYDPEINHYANSDLRLGTENRTYPQSRTITAGIKLGL